jgi:tetratricopeptide (TPR) repeat protein
VGIVRFTTLLEMIERREVSQPLAALYAVQAQIRFAAGQYGEALAQCERAAMRANIEGDESTRLTADGQRLNLLQLMGRLGEALRLGAALLPVLDAYGDLDGLLRAQRDLAYIHVLRGAFATSRRHLVRALALAEQMADAAQHAFTLAFDGWTALLGGDMSDARARMDRAAELGRLVDGAVFSAYLLVFQARLFLVQGTWGEARAAAQAALSMAKGYDDLQVLRWAADLLAQLDVHEGHPQAAIDGLIPLLDRPGLEECDVTTLLPVLAWAQLELGRLDEAAATVEQVLARARREAMRLVLVEALRVRALIALRRGQWSTAAGSLEEGLVLARAMPHPYAEARLLHVYGRLHVGQDEPALARERLEAALALFTGLSARSDAARVEQALSCLSQKQEAHEGLLTDAQWTQIAALLPPRRPGRGRPRADDRRTLEAILYVQRTGCAWADLPAVFGDEATAYRRWREWQAASLWATIATIAGISDRDGTARPAGRG